MSKWSILKNALTGKNKGRSSADATSASVSIHRHQGFELYTSKELKTFPWTPIYIDVEDTIDSTVLSSSSILSDDRFRKLLKSLLDERDLSVGYLREMPIDTREVSTKTAHITLGLPSCSAPSFTSFSPESANTRVPNTRRFQLSFESKADRGCINEDVIIQRSQECEVIIPLINSNFKAYTIVSNTLITTREWKEVAKLSLAERMKGLMSNKLHGIDNTGNVRVWTAEHILLYTLQFHRGEEVH